MRCSFVRANHLFFQLLMLPPHFTTIPVFLAFFCASADDKDCQLFIFLFTRKNLSEKIVSEEGIKVVNSLIPSDPCLVRRDHFQIDFFYISNFLLSRTFYQFIKKIISPVAFHLNFFFKISKKKGEKME